MIQNETSNMQNNATATTTTSLRQVTFDTVDRYLSQVDLKQTTDVYDMVLAEIEEPMLNALLTHVRGNQSKAAKVLGINRGTLRKKLKRYGKL